MSLSDDTAAPAAPAEERGAAQLRRAMGALRKLQTELSQLKQAQNEPIAIVGFAARMPQVGASTDAFWEQLLAGADLTAPPSARRKAPCATGLPQKAGFLPEIDCFDASRFEISPKEAGRLDPQHRILLELADAALDAAGLGSRAGHAAGPRKIGVYVGMSSGDYRELLDPQSAQLDAFCATGTTPCFSAGRISYALNLTGPAMVVDTACSSALVALHLACAALRRGECDAALGGGVNIITSAFAQALLEETRSLSPSGICRPFDARADGFVRGEGGALFVLKRLSDALASGDEIRAVIRGSAINQDGKSNGLTAPNPEAQTAVIREALRNADLSAEAISYVEAHGTGTALGDPIEMEALTEVFARAGEPCRVSSVKSNIGHLEAAAGAASVLKLALCMARHQLPAQSGFATLNPHIAQSEGAPEILAEARDWGKAGETVYAGVSSFGMSGTNAHVILSSADDYAPARAPTTSELGEALIVPLSAADPERLLRRAAELGARMQSAPDPVGAAAACCLAAGGQLERMAVVARDPRELSQRLLDPPLSNPNVLRGRRDPNTRGKVAFLFSGQGSQYAHMGAALYRSSASYRQAFDACDALFSPLLGESLRARVFSDDGGLERTEWTQPALFAVEYALAAFWRALGVEPDFVAGHSIGEYVAATVSGILSLEDAIAMVAARAQAMGALPKGGAMLAAWCDGQTTAQIATEICAESGGPLALAATNSDNQAVLSGAEQAIAEAERRLNARGVRTQRLVVSHAFHSPLVAPAVAGFRAGCETIEFAPPKIPIVCNLTGKRAAAQELASLDYWSQQIVSTVRFAETVQTLRDNGVTTWLEVGPHPVLTPMLGARSNENAAASLLRGRDDCLTMSKAVAGLWVAGVPIAWDKLFHGSAPHWRVSPEPVARLSHWLPSGLSRTETLSSADAAAGASVAPPQPNATEAALEAPVEASIEIGWHSFELPAQIAAMPAILLPLAPEAGEDFIQIAATHTESTVLDPGWTQGATVAEMRDALLGEWDRQIAKDSTAVANVFVLPPQRIDTSAELGRELAVCTAVFQALSKRRDRQPLRLWLVTRGGQLANGMEAQAVSAAAVHHGSLGGFAQVAALEYPDLVQGVLDLPLVEEASPADLARGLQAVEDNQHDWLALREGRVYGRIATSAAPRPPAGPVEFAAQDWVIVTGGLGSIGLATLEWLAARGARQLLVISRSAVDCADPDRRDKRQRCLARLAAAGVRCEIFVGDAADPALLGSAVDFAADHGGLGGVFCLSGTTSRQNLDDMSATIDPLPLVSKLESASILSALCPEVRHFVVFSSVSALWGTPGEAVYAAANAGLDRLIAARRQCGQSGCALHWGAWAASAMVGDADQEWLARLGMTALSAQDGLAFLSEELDAAPAAGPSTSGHRVLARMDWRRFVATYQARRRYSLFRDLGAMLDLSPAQGNQRQGPQSARAIAELVERTVSTILGYDEGQSLPTNRGFTELGMESISAVDLARALSAQLSVAITPATVFDHPTVERLSEHLAKEMLKDEGPAQPMAAKAPHSPEPQTARQTIDQDVSQSTGRPVAPTGEAFAIVGVGCRLPGGVRDLDGLWRLLSSGKDGLSDIPWARWPHAGADPALYVRRGGFLDAVYSFDASFFGISPREADFMDPQQRLLLQCSWEAMQDGALFQSDGAPKDTGVFVGISNSDYGLMMARSQIDQYFASGSALSAVPGRIAHYYGFEGPTLAVDTACSSSLVALHLACQALTRRECATALVAGVNLMLSHEVTLATCRNRMMSEKGRCATFDAAADGYIRSEGCVVLAVKRLEDAQLNADRILGVVRGSAVNQDGASSALTVPNGDAQRRVIARALENAGLSGGQVHYVEAHGTGTPLGDPIEAEAAWDAYRGNSRDPAPLWIGSVKSNLGHLEAAAGLAGVLKGLGILRHGQIPASLHFQDPNPHIPWDRIGLRVPQQIVPLPAQEAGLVAVSGFGFTGTNAHVLLGRAPEPDAATLAEPESRADHAALAQHGLLSARSPAALTALIETYLERFAQTDRRDARARLREALNGRSQQHEFRAVLAFDEALRPKAQARAETAARFQTRLRLDLRGRPVLGAGAADLLRALPEIAALTGPMDGDPAEAALLATLAWMRLLGLEVEVVGAAWLGSASPRAAMVAPLNGPAPVATGTSQKADDRLNWVVTDDRIIAPDGTEIMPSARLADTWDALLAALFLNGMRLKMAALTGGRMVRHAPLAAYPWQLKDYRLPRAAGQPVFTMEAAQGAQSLAIGAHRADHPAYLTDHRLFKTVVVPAASHLAQLLVLLRREEAAATVIATDLAFPRALVLDDAEDVAVQIAIEGQPDAPRTLKVRSAKEAGTDAWTPHLVGRIATAAEGGDALARWADVPAIPAQSHEISGKDFYAYFAAVGYTLGPSFRWIDRIWRREHEAFCRMKQPVLPDRVEDYSLYPGLIDSCFQLLACWMVTEGSAEDDALAIPFHCDRLTLSTKPPQGELTCHMRRRRSGDFDSQSEVVDIDLYDETGARYLEARGFRTRRAAREVLQRSLHRGGGISYVEDWQVAPLGESPVEDRGGRYLLLSDGGAQAQSLTERLTAAGHEVAVLTLAPEDLADLSQIREKLRAALGGRGVDHVVSLWGRAASPAETTPHDTGPHDTTPHDTRLTFATTLVTAVSTALQGVLAHGGDSPGSINLVTEDAVSVTGEGIVLPERATLVGLASALRRELPGTEVRLIDLEDAAADDWSATLVAELARADEPRLCYRAGQRWVARLRPADPSAAEAPHLPEDRSFVITGGTGLLGLKIAERWIGHGAKRVALISRGQPSEAVRARMADLAADLAAEVAFYQADVGDLDQLRAVLHRIRADLGPIGGVIHAAGVLTDAAFAQQSPELFATAMSAKAGGLRWLDQETRGDCLSHFIVFSSVASRLGSAGQASYAAANAFADALIEERRLQGLPGLAVNWGPWSGGGMLAEAGAAAQRRLDLLGVHELDETGLAALDEALTSPGSHRIVIDADWDRYKAALRRPDPLFDALGTARPVAPEPAEAAPRAGLLRRLSEARTAQRPEILSQGLTEIVARIMNIDDLGSVNWSLGFTDLGLDSLMALDLQSRLKDELALEVSATVALDYPDIERLSAHLLDQFDFGPTEELSSEDALLEAALKQLNQLNGTGV
ncbi:type I polyketide synthase [Paracoccus aminophilus]|uniref:6-deoxyerythronolide-B synthase n=1 Tax=Paracoccus aminophilus JCM 7686 TaxID=1367847 RepID=S5XXF6_PARAH|nr:type I polyketide synthase [Paracoccus aminophilus]AGT08110.1 6-deoxyerythronolide-B synthase [Paracoccus aminophilus JCM 7686]